MPEQVILNCQKDQPAQVGAFGCNGAAPQTAAIVGAEVDDTAADDTAPFGYTEAQANALIASVNAIRAALVANGIAVAS